MRKLFALFAASLLCATLAHAQTGRVCAPFDSTFHYLQPGNLSVWIQGGVLTTNRSRNLTLHHSMAFNIHFVPVRYLQVGVHSSKRLPSNDLSFWKSNETSLFARYTFLRMACPEIGVFGQGGYTKVTEVRKNNGGKTVDWYPYAGFGMYKDLGRHFSLQVESQLYFNNRPNQASVSLVWKFMNCKF
ncbi:MAG TPA: hypothetical protein VD993_07625 [Chitinophagaceae bacterium]|nr:hypothetical protein [Chitinophagaceae bacterium]